MGRLLSLLAVSSMLACCLPALCGPPAEAAGGRATQTVWSGDVYLSSDLEVGPDTELLVTAGARVFLGADVNITVWGNMTVRGTSASPVLFNWSGPRPNRGSIYMGGAARRSHFENCTFQSAYVGIYASYSALDVSDCNFSYCLRDGLHVTGTGFTVRNSGFFKNSFDEPFSTNAAIYLNAASGQVEGNRFSDNSNCLFIKDYAQVAVRNNTFGDSPAEWSHGIHLRSGAAASIEDNRISGQMDGICSNGSSPAIRRNLIENNRRNGLLLVEKDASVIEGNTIRDNGDEGVELNTLSEIVLRSNDISGNADNGVMAHGARLWLSENDISGNNVGVLATDGANVSSSKNKVHGNRNAGMAVKEKGSFLNSSGDVISDNTEEGLDIETGEARFEDVFVGGSRTNLVATNGSRTGFVNGTMGSPTARGMDIRSSFVRTLNLTFDNSSADLSGADALLRICWYLGLSIVDQDGRPIAGADIAVLDLDGSCRMTGRTDGGGTLRWLELCEKELSTNGNERPYTPHRVIADVPGTGNETTIVLDRSRDILMRIQTPNSPPRPVLPIPDLSFPEDTDAPGLLDLSRHFSDEGPLTYEVSFEEDASTINAEVNGAMLDFSTPTENWYGVRQFRVRATDDKGLATESNNFTVEVTPVDDPPVLSPAGPFVVGEGATLEAALAATDIDDAPGSLRFVLHTLLPDGLAIGLDSSTGRFTFRSVLPGNFTVLFGARDPAGLSSESVPVLFRVLPANRPPSFLSSPPGSVPVCGTWSYRPSFSDPEDDPLLLELAHGPDGLKLDDGKLLWTPGWGQLGEAAVSLRLGDGVNPPVFQNFTIRVLPVNRPPVAEILSPAGGAFFQYRENISFRGRGTDPDGDALTFRWIVDGSMVVPGRDFDRALVSGNHTVSFSVSDGVLTSWRNITVEVGPPPGPGPRPRYRDVTVSDDGWLLWLLLALAIVGTVAVVIYFRLRPE